MESYANKPVHSEGVIRARHTAAHQEKIAHRRKKAMGVLAVGTSVIALAAIGPKDAANALHSGPVCEGAQSVTVLDYSTRLQDLKNENIENTGNSQLDLSVIDTTIERRTPDGIKEVHGVPLVPGDVVAMPKTCEQ